MKQRLPIWFRQEIPDISLIRERIGFFRGLRLNTVCESAHCPNLYDCFKRNTATFMILGDICTRNCRFCAVKKAGPLSLDPEEPDNIVSAVKQLNLKYVVITAVTRDDLDDGGASQFACIIKRLRQAIDRVKIEVLVPDFKGKTESLKTVLEASPDVVGHNLETVPRLYAAVRPQADYGRSLNLLAKAKEIDNSVITKSGIMVGLGEDFGEVVGVMEDLKKVGCDILTIGQYLAPSAQHFPVQRFVREEEFFHWQDIASALGFRQVYGGPLVRSSFHSEEIFAKCMM